MQSRFLTMAAGYGPSRVPDNARFVSQLAKVIRQVLLSSTYQGAFRPTLCSRGR